MQTNIKMFENKNLNFLDHKTSIKLRNHVLKNKK